MNEIEEEADDLWQAVFLKQIEVTGSGDGNLCTEIIVTVIDELLKLEDLSEARLVILKQIIEQG